jgi:uncharacterized membrane protein
MESDVEQRLAAIETRLGKIEGALRLGPPMPRPVAVTGAAQTAAPVKPAAPKVEMKPGNWLGIIAVICFVLAAGFIVKLSIDSGWLTPARQIGMAALLGFALIGAGLALLRSDRGYASLLPGGGVIVLYITASAAHLLYKLISFEVAIACTSAVSALCIVLYLRIRHDAYALTAAAGAYVAPVLLELGSGEVFSLYYFVLCSVAFATISIWVRSRALTVVSAYLALFMSGVIGLEIGHDALLAELLAVHFFVFAIGTFVFALRHKTPLKEAEAWSLLPVLLLFYALEYYLLDGLVPGLAPWISLGFAAVLAGLYLSAKRVFPEGLGSQSLILTFASVVCFHAGYLVLVPDADKPWLFSVILLGLAFAPFDVSMKAERRAYIVPVLALVLIVVIEYMTMLNGLFDETGNWIAVSVAAFASLWAVLAFSPKPRAHRDVFYVLLAMAHVLAVLGSYRLTHAVSSLAVSACWLFYAVAVLVFASLRKDKLMAQSALLVLGFAAGKALLFDAASAATVVRIFCLLLTGVVLYGCGLFLRRVSDWDKKPEALQAP